MYFYLITQIVLENGLNNQRQTHISGALLITIFIALRTLNQILFKNIAIGPGGSSYFSLIMQPLFYISCVIFLAQALVWLMVLRRFDLSTAYPFTSITFITLLVSGALFFDESITLGNVLGSVLIMAGVVIISRNQCSKQDNGIRIS